MTQKGVSDIFDVGEALQLVYVSSTTQAFNGFNSQGQGLDYRQWILSMFVV